MRFCCRLRDSTSQGSRWRRGLDVERQRTADAIGDGLESQQGVLRLDRHRLGRDLRRDRGVAVAIAADPAADAKEGRGRVRPTECDVERPHELRRHAKQRLVENGHERADLVEWLHVHRANLSSPPQRIDLLDQPSFRVAPFGVRNPRIVKALQLLAHATDRRDHRAPSRLRGVRREDRVDLEVRNELVESLAAQLWPKVPDRGGQGFGLGLRSAVALAKHARAVVLFGEIGQVEVARERARHLLRAIEPPRGDELFSLAFVPVVIAGTDDKTSKFLDVPQQVRAAVIGDDLPEQPAQQADVAPQRLGDLLPRGLPGLRQSGSTETMYSSESTSASSDASMMLLEHPTVVHRFVPLPDSTRTRVVAAVPASPFRMRTL